jgi:HD-like signal output (HDOD) protein
MRISAAQYAQKSQELCVLPDVYLRLKEILESDEASLDSIADIISLDPALASCLLKIANSALFNFPKEVDSIPRALMILGIKEVHNLINTYGVTAAFSGVNPQIMDMDKFWEISVDCALLTKFLANRKHIKNSEGLFLSGLFHNIGELAIVHNSPKKVQYCEAYTSDETPWQRQLDVFGFTFAECSAELLSLWHLPEVIITPIREFNNAYNEELSPESTLLYIASRLAIVNSHPGIYSKVNLIGKHLLEDLNISMADIDDALEFCNAEGMAIMSALKVIG